MTRRCWREPLSLSLSLSFHVLEIVFHSPFLVIVCVVLLWSSIQHVGCKSLSFISFITIILVGSGEGREGGERATVTAAVVVIVVVVVVAAVAWLF